MPRSLNLTSAPYDRDADYEVVARWWREIGVAPLPLHASPRLGLWAIADDDVRVAAAFAYSTTADLFIMAFPIACPALSWRHKAEAMSFAVSTLAKAIRDRSPRTIIISLSHDGTVHQTYVKRAGFCGTGKTWIGVSAPADVNVDILTE